MLVCLFYELSWDTRFILFRFCGGVDFFSACLLGEIAVYPHKRLELSLLWDVSAEVLSCVTETNYEGIFG